MARNVEVYRSLQSADAQALSIFALACAERGSGIFRTVASSADREWYSRILELAWRAAVGEAAEDELVEVIDEFETRAGSSEDDEGDDPDSREFSALQSAMLAVNAIAVYLSPSPARAELSGQTLETLLSSFDFKLGGSRAVIVSAGESGPPPGPLQQMEQDAQTAIMREIANGAELSSEFLDSLRTTCQIARDDIAAATLAVAEVSGWDTVDTED
ncbi:hypothetical protein [Nocardia sp. NPDC056100]|uniref:hypothetical protein n=1 Tax=Nocardia sp. NPDC056100 TaxID=3345712 RepID=UPI0035DB5277